MQLHDVPQQRWKQLCGRCGRQRAGRPVELRITEKHHPYDNCDGPAAPLNGRAALLETLTMVPKRDRVDMVVRTRQPYVMCAHVKDVQRISASEGNTPTSLRVEGANGRALVVRFAEPESILTRATV